MKDTFSTPIDTPARHAGLLAVSLGLAAALGSGGALAQSSVTVFGILDFGVMYIKNGSEHRKLMSLDGVNTSRLGFRGAEDLGGGLSASFHLEGALTPDDGNAGGFNFRRRSTVSLVSTTLGEVRLGRDYTPTFWNLSIFSPFGTNGVGSSGSLMYGFGGSSGTAPTIVRSDNSIADNSIGYFLPKNLGGVYGQAMVAAAEGAVAGKYYGARVGYAGGPVDVALAYGETTNAANGDKFKSLNLGASYNFGVAKLSGIVNQSKQDVRKQTSYMVGGVVPLGAGEIHAAYVRADTANSDNDANQWSLGYVHNLSKRTALYTAASRITNKGAAKFAIGGVTNGPPAVVGQASTGVEAGIRHIF